MHEKYVGHGPFKIISQIDDHIMPSIAINNLYSDKANNHFCMAVLVNLLSGSDKVWVLRVAKVHALTCILSPFQHFFGMQGVPMK
jgi:hypothetical protein